MNTKKREKVRIRSYNVITENGTHLRRNRRHVKLVNEPFEGDKEPVLIPLLVSLLTDRNTSQRSESPKEVSQPKNQDQKLHLSNWDQAKQQVGEVVSFDFQNIVSTVLSNNF